MFFDFVVLALAIFNIAMFFHSDNGPGHAFDWIRHQANQLARRRRIYLFSDMLKCPVCLSVWVGLLLLWVHSLDHWLAGGFLLWMGLIGLVRLLICIAGEREII